MSMDKLTEDLEQAPEHSVVMLSASAHCPTGADLSQQDWTALVEVMAVKPI